MSRFEIFKNGKGLAFGNDFYCGDYLQIWDATKTKMPDSENILVDEDKLTGLTRPKMLKLLEEYGFTEKELEQAYIRGSGSLESL